MPQINNIIAALTADFDLLSHFENDEQLEAELLLKDAIHLTKANLVAAYGLLSPRDKMTFADQS
jgi:hypothetical protein